jgi:plasmid maintenance system antidote protein VapI
MKEHQKHRKERKEILPENIWGDSNSRKKTKEFIEEFKRKQPSEQKLDTRLKAIQYKMEDYIAQGDSANIIEIVDFINDFLKLFRMQKNEFAKILGMNYANLYKYLNGERKLNADLVFKISSFSHTTPEMWLFIEAKNNMLELKKNKQEITKYEKYKFENFLFSASE